MGRNKAVSLCVALVCGSVFAVAVSSWRATSRPSRWRSRDGAGLPSARVSGRATAG